MAQTENLAQRAITSRRPDAAPSQRLVDAIGLRATLRLIKSLGGTTIPAIRGVSLSGDKRLEALATIVGHAATKRLLEMCAGERLYVPSSRRVLVAERNRRIRREHVSYCEGGLSRSDATRLLSIKYRISDRQIWNILKIGE